MKNYNFRQRISTIQKGITRKQVAIAASLGLAVLIIVPVATYANYAQDIGNKERLMNRNSTGIILRDKNGEIFYEYGKLNATDQAKLSGISDNFENALIASEDKDFRNHEGYSIRGIASATYANILNKDATRYGGSTITQQLVKNKLLSNEKSFLRKYQEVSMAVAVERRYTKDEILEMYINSVYYGEGAFGITDAAKTYFNKNPQDLTLAESSMLVGLLPAPTTYSPISGNKEKAKEQQKRVLDKMSEDGVITTAEKNAISAENIAYNPATTEQRNNHAQHFAEMVIDELKDKYSEETVIRMGYDVTTSLDLNWQKQAEANAQERVQALGQAGARNASVVAIDPKNGQVRALVGSVDWNNPTFGKVNMATSVRQPGSSFKPIYYSEAMDKKLITPATILEDKPKTYGGTYKPTNYDFKYRGNIPVRNALSQSLNIPAVDVMEKLGTEDAASAARRMGISTVTEPDKYGLSLALGTAEVKLYEMVNAYASFANKGQQFQPTLITKIQDKYDAQVFEVKPQVAKQVTSPEASYLISSILSDNQARSPTFGNALNIQNRKVAVKTGTTNDSKDAWTIGYTPSVVVGVWMGNNENEPMVGLAGSSSAGGVWKNSMTNFLGNSPNEEFERPANIISMQICAGSGLKAAGKSGKTYEEFFIKGTEPTKECNKAESKPAEAKPEDKKPEMKLPEQRREDESGAQEQPKPNQSREGNSGSGGRGGDSTTPTTPAPQPTQPPPSDSEPKPAT